MQEAKLELLIKLWVTVVLFNRKPIFAWDIFWTKYKNKSSYTIGLIIIC